MQKRSNCAPRETGRCLVDLKKHLLENQQSRRFYSLLWPSSLSARPRLQSADLGAAPRYTKAPAYVAPIYNWTGFYIGGHLGGGFAGDNSILGSTPLPRRHPGRRRLSVRAELGRGHRSPVQLVPATTMASLFPGGTHVSSNSDQLGSVTGRLGYTFGPALLYAKGGYAWKDGDHLAVTPPARRSLSPPTAAIAMVTPSVPASNTCSHRTGRPRSNTCITTSEAPPSSPRSASPAPGSTTMSMS